MEGKAELFDLLSSLVLTPAVSGNEAPLRKIISRQLAQGGIDAGRLKRDELGNCWLTFGPSEDPERLLIAHMDELGLRITSIREDGLCHVAAVGGIDPQLWEGTPIVVHTQGGPVPGCVAPVSLHVTERQGHGPKERMKIKDLLLDLGAMSPAEVAALGVCLLDSVTWPKAISRLYGDLVQARSLDDRFGCAALVATALQLQQNPPSVPVALAWSVQEEVGLRGARALIPQFATCREVIAVDSFTVGLGPRDNRQFDGPRPGGGAVLRCWDSTVLVPDELRWQLLDKARGLGIELQYGYMPGGNDASVFSQGGASTFAFGVPVQYSHSAAERIHMGDLYTLIELLVAWCSSTLEVG